MKAEALDQRGRGDVSPWALVFGLCLIPPAQRPEGYLGLPCVCPCCPVNGEMDGKTPPPVPESFAHVELRTSIDAGGHIGLWMARSGAPAWAKGWRDPLLALQLWVQEAESGKSCRVGV